MNLRGLVLFALYLLGIVGGVATALILKRTLLRGPTPTFLIEMPPYRWPSARSVLLRLRDRVSSFLVRAGTVIFAVSVIVWALVYFPRPAAIGERFDAQRSQVSAALDGAELESRLATLDNEEAFGLPRGQLPRPPGALRRAGVRSARVGLACLVGHLGVVPGARDVLAALSARSTPSVTTSTRTIPV